MWYVKKVNWDDEVSVVLTGTDPMELAKAFCEEEIIPDALARGKDTKIAVQKAVTENDWIEILDIYMTNPGDMFFTPQSFEIVDDDNNVFYPLSKRNEKA
jgi:hypothetical protein